MIPRVKKKEEKKSLRISRRRYDQITLINNYNRTNTCNTNFEYNSPLYFGFSALGGGFFFGRFEGIMSKYMVACVLFVFSFCY